MKHQIRCKVYPGQFSNEYAVSVKTPGSSGFSLFAPLRAVETEEPPTRDRPVDGWLEVSIWERRGDKAVVQLPRESFESGRYVTVEVTQFRAAPEEVPA